MQILKAVYLVTVSCSLLASGAAYATNEKVEPLQLIIKADKLYYKVGDPISIAAEIKNTTKQDLFFYIVESSLTATYNLIDPTGKTVDIAYAIADPGLPSKEDFVLIRTGESLPKHFEVHFQTGGRLQPGSYTLSMTYRVNQNWYFDSQKSERVDLNAWIGVLTSNKVKVELR